MAQGNETKYTTSFIPKEPVYANKNNFSRKSGPSVMMLIGLVIFFSAILVAVGFLGWKIQTQNIIEEQIGELVEARDSFDEDTISAATRLNDRIIAVKDLLDKHKAPSAVFAFLEDSILETVQLKSLEYSTEDDGTIRITGDGIALRFESVVLQSDEFGKTGVFKDVLFSDVQSTGPNLPVSFVTESSVDNKAVLYRRKILNQTGEDTGGVNIFDSATDESAEEAMGDDI